MWILVKYKDLGASDEELLEDFPFLKAKDLVAAWEYSLTHEKEIQAAIRAQEER